MSSIDTGACYIGTILRDGKPYLVPKFQRDYSWKNEQISLLWEDMFRSLSENYSSYFIGSMVINDSDPSGYTVIDGQQRLTTFSILLCALRDIARERDSSALADRLGSDFLGKFEYATGETTPKLTLNQNNRQYYHDKIINNVSLEVLQADLKNRREHKSNRLIAEAYLFFYNKIQIELESGQLLSEFIQKIVSAIDDVIQIIRITVKDDYDAYMLFETLNDRGLALSVADLLKNYLFSKADDHRLEDVQDNWQEMSANLDKIETKRFLRHLWLSKYGVVRDRDLYRSIKDKYKTKTSVLNFSKELRDSSDVYAALDDPQSQIWTMFPDRDRRKIEEYLDDLSLFGVNQYNPLLLSTLEENPNIFLSVLKTVVTFAFRYSIILGSGTGNIERTFSDVAIFVRNTRSCSARDVFNRISHLYPGDMEFLDAFADKVISRSNMARYILRKINDQAEESSGLRVDKNGFAMTLEHILPQKFSQEDWSDFCIDGDEPKEYVHRLGNMTILSSSLNRRASNGSFSEKLARFC